MTILKTSKKISSQEKDMVAQLKKFYKTYDQLACCSLTWIGALHIVIDYISSMQDICFLPKKVQYGMSLGIYHLYMLRSIARNEADPKNFSMEYMPVQEDAWTSNDQLDARMALIVKQLYNFLKAEGKIDETVS